jgi:adenylate cyclase
MPERSEPQSRRRAGLKHDVLRLALLSAASGWLLAMGLTLLPLWQSVENRVFDLFSVYTAPRETVMPITIVAIDEASSTQLNMRWPYPRELHAELIDRLVQAGAAVIAFDVQFSEPSNPQSDARFADAIANAGNVVLASKFEYHETATARQFMRMDPVLDFTLAGAGVGLTDMQFRGDNVPRLMALEDQAFWREAIRMLIRVIPGSVEEPGVPENAMIRYLGPRYTYPYVSYYQVINGDPGIPEDFFVDSIVLVGRDAGATTDINTAQADAFATPFTLTTGVLTAGVEIHATQIENALLGNMLEPATRAQNIALTTAAILLTLPLLLFWHPLRNGILLALMLGGLAGAALWLFREHNIWVQTATPLTGMLTAFLMTGSGSFLTERRRAGEIRGAFSKYVSAEVVAEMIAHPERLRLGGQRRDISVLFSDLAGFTSLSEKLTPDVVAQVVNLYLNAMSRIIMKNGGTVDKFIGDAVMAFWGAPLEDEEHAAHALQSAIEMQQAMRDLEPEFSALGVDRLGLRIGVNSGPAIVGNMGSDQRFSYTAMGDTVNLASRLEGANKAYGTPILLAASTAEIVRGRFALRRVDRVRVKGKEQAVDVFTPCTDPVLIEASEAAWNAYLMRDWASCLAHLERIRGIEAADPVAAAFAQRIAEFATTAPPDDWDGSVALDKL